MGLMKADEMEAWAKSPEGQRFLGTGPEAKAAAAAKAEAENQLMDELEAHGAGHPGVRRGGHSVKEFMEAVAVDEAAGLHVMQSRGEPDHNDLLGEELEQHPLRPTPIIRGA